jgi:hypothetical protein
MLKAAREEQGKKPERKILRKTPETSKKHNHNYKRVVTKKEREKNMKEATADLCLRVVMLKELKKEFTTKKVLFGSNITLNTYLRR